MADPHSPPEMWSWLDSIWGFGSGVVLAVLAMLGWVNPKLKKIENAISVSAAQAHHENDDLAGELHDRMTSMEKLIAVLQENNRESMRMYISVKDELKALNAITAEQTKILYQMRGALKIKGDSHE